MFQGRITPRSVIFAGCGLGKSDLAFDCSFASAIDDDVNQKKFRDGSSNRVVSRAYEDFTKRFKSCKSKPTDPALIYDLETQVESIFQFFRICRNEVGHPHIPSNLDKGVLLANMGSL